MSKARKDLQESDDLVASSDSFDDDVYRDLIFEYETELNKSLKAEDKMEEYVLISDDEDAPLNPSNSTIHRSSGGNNMEVELKEEDKSGSDIIFLSSDSDSDLPDIWSCRSDRNRSNKYADVSIPSTSNVSGNGKQASVIKQESTSQQSTANEIKDEKIKPEIKDDSSEEAFEWDGEDNGESFNEQKSSSRTDQLPTMEYKSEDEAEEQSNGMLEEDSKLNQSCRQTGQDEPRECDEQGYGNIRTVGDFLLTDTQSYSQVEPAENILFENETWENLHPDSPGSHSIGSDPAPESPSPQGSPSSFTTDYEENDAGRTVQSQCTCASGRDVLDCPDSQCPHYMLLLKQALQGKEPLVLEKIPLPPDFPLESVGIYSGPECVYKRPKRDHIAGKKRRRACPDISNDSSSTDDDPLPPVGRRKPDTPPIKEADFKRKGKVKRKTREGRRRREKRQKLAREFQVHSLGKDGSREDSMDENPWPQDQSGEQSEREDRFSPSLNGGTEEVPMDTSSDEENHKLLRGSVVRKKPVIAESDTDSDETCIEDNEASSSQTCSIKSQSLSSNETSAHIGEKISDCLHNSRVSADSVSPERTTLTCIAEPIVGEEGTSTDNSSPLSHQALNIKQDLPRSETSTDCKDEGNGGTAAKKKLKTIKDSKQSNHVRNGNSPEGHSEFDKAASYRIEPVSEGKTLKHRLIAVKKASKNLKKKSKSSDASNGEGLLSKDSHSLELECSPDEINTGMFYGTSNGTKTGPVSTESKPKSRSSVPARAESWDEILRNGTEGESSSPVPLTKGEEEDGNEREDAVYPETMPFSPSADFSDENEDSADFYSCTQPFSPMLDGDSANLTSDEGNESGISQTTCPGDSPSHLADDSKQEPTNHFPNDSQISCLSSSEEVPDDIDADVATSSSLRSTDENDFNLPHMRTGEDSPLQYFPTDSQLSISLDSEETEELANQNENEKPASDEEPEGPNENGGRKLLPCQQNAWSLSDLDPMQQFLMLDEVDADAMSQDYEEIPPSPNPVIRSTSTAEQGINEQQGAKKNTRLQRPSRADNLLSSMKQTETKKNPKKKTRPVQDIPHSPSNPSGLYLGDFSEVPPTSSVNSLQDQQKQVQATRFNEEAEDHAVTTTPGTMSSSLPGNSNLPYSLPSLDLANTSESSMNQTDDLGCQLAGSAIISEEVQENTVTAVTKSVVSSLPSVPSLSSPSPSFYLAHISDSSRNQTEGLDSHSDAPGTSHNTEGTVKATPEIGQDGPSGSTNPSSTAASIIPLKKRPVKVNPQSPATQVPSGKPRTESSEASWMVYHGLRTEDILACLLSWNTDWYEKHKEVSSSEILQSFLGCKELPRSCKSYSDVRSYQEAFSCFLLVEMWCKVSCSVAEDCPGMWRQNSRVNQLSKDVVEVQYESDEDHAEAHGMIEGDLVLVDMSTISATQKQFQFGLVQCNGPTDRTVCLALHKSTAVPSCTRIRVVTSLRHYLNQIRALLSFNTNPLARHIVKPEDSPVFTQEPSETQDTDPHLKLLNSYIESLARPEVIRLMTGPAGTGKTTDLHRLVRWITRLHRNNTAKSTYKVLVCAPTSQSLDVLLRRIWKGIIKHTQNPTPGSSREELKHIVDGVRIVRVGHEEEANRNLTPFLLSSIATSMREQGSSYDKLSDDQLHTKILQQADIVGCTLEDCGLEIVRSSLKGKVYALVVDDASHCLETEILLALQCRIEYVFMAGDQDQSIVSVRSKESKHLGYCRSMLQRLSENFETEDNRIHRWEIQHRMKQEIANFPSKNFYSQRLKTLTNAIPFHLRPYIIFDMVDGKESTSKEPVINSSEILFINELLSSISTKDPFSLGIIAESSGQKTRLLERLQGNRFPGLLIGTPADFYGYERDVIILSCTCTSTKTPNDNGFVLNNQLLNLVLTRAKLSLIIVGNMKNMQEVNSHWKSLVTDATERQLVFETPQASYRTNVKKCLTEQTTNPGTSRNRTEQHPSLYRPSLRYPQSQPQRYEGNGRDRRNSGNMARSTQSASSSHPEQQPGNPFACGADSSSRYAEGPPQASDGNHRYGRNSGNSTPAKPYTSSSRPEQLPGMSFVSGGHPSSRYSEVQPQRSEGDHCYRRNSGNATPANPHTSRSRTEQHPGMYFASERQPTSSYPDGQPQQSEGDHRYRRNSGNKTSANPSASTGRPDLSSRCSNGQPQGSDVSHCSRRNSGSAGMSSASVSRPPPDLEQQDRPTERIKDKYRDRYDPGSQGNPAYGRGHHPKEADPVMPSGVNSLPEYEDSASRSSIPPNRGNDPMDVREHNVPEAPTGILRRQSSETFQVSSNGMVQNSSRSKQSHIPDETARVKRGTPRVHFDQESLHHKRAGSTSTGQYVPLVPPSRDSSSRGGILKKPCQNTTAASIDIHQEDFPTIDDPVQHNTRCQRTPVTHGAPFRSTTHGRNNQNKALVLDTDNGKTFNSIATGMQHNSRIATQGRGKTIAGRTFGKRKCQTSRRKESNEDRDRSPCGEVTNGGGSRKGRRVECRMHDQTRHQDQPQPRSRRQAPPPQPIPERRVQRTEELNRLANNPVQLDPNMLHNRIVHERFGGRSTALTEPQPNIRRRRRSNQVKDREMDFRD